mgnify:FL=1
MKVKACALLTAMLASSVSFGSTIAIIDSGVDIQHEALAGKIWTNSIDNTINRRDDDKNGYKDDINGWNFFGNNARLINYKHNDLFNDDVERFFRIQGDLLQGTASEEDLNWVKEMVQDQEFVGSLNKFGAYVHGTHVAAIAAKGNDLAAVSYTHLTLPTICSV